MNDREIILSRVREALSAPTDEQVRHGLTAGLSDEAVGEEATFRAFLPRVGEAYEDRKRMFAEHSKALKTSFVVVASLRAAHAKLRQLAQIEGWRRIGAHRGELAGPASEAVGLATVFTDGGYVKRELEPCDAGVTDCEALIAQTGSVLVKSASSGGRALSVLPPHHIVLARREQMLADLPAGFRLIQEKYHRRYPSFISYITGPSRTGDIERVLVLGAHGPKRLTVILI